MDRGILSTIYVRIKRNVTLSGIQKLYHQFYRNEPFVRVLKNGRYPSTKAVKGTNFCDMSLFLDRRSGRDQTLIIVTAIDNLLKGASGTAIHNMNIMYGFDESTGLLSAPVFP
jgi:N-acetyl-gamma-glutamyl-phosphate reductase